MDMNHLDVPLEIKSIDDEQGDGFFRFEGLASTFNKDLGDDIIQPGAFKESISKQSPIILFQHDQSEPIGVTDEIKETKSGLFIKARLPIDDDLVRGRVIPQMKVGSLRTMSIGFRMGADDFEFKDGVRIINKVELPEVSLVTFPMNPEAVVTGFKNIEDVKEIDNKRDFENVLRESGSFSRSAASFLASLIELKQDEPADSKGELSDECAQGEPADTGSDLDKECLQGEPVDVMKSLNDELDNALLSISLNACLKQLISK